MDPDWVDVFPIKSGDIPVLLSCFLGMEFDLLPKKSNNRMVLMAQGILASKHTKQKKSQLRRAPKTKCVTDFCWAVRIVMGIHEQMWITNVPVKWWANEQQGGGWATTSFCCNKALRDFYDF